MDNGREDNTQEELRDNDERVQLEDQNPIFRPVWKDNTGRYLWGVRGCSLSTTEKRERQCKRKLEKLAFTTRSIVDMFSVQSNKNKSLDKNPLSTPLPAPPLSKSSKKVKDTRLESQTRAAQDIGGLLRLKTVQINRYKSILDHKSNLHLQYKIV